MADIRIPLDLPDVRVEKVEERAGGGWTITVESSLKSTKCRQCGREIKAFHGHDSWVEVRHLPILDRAVFIRYRPKRYRCEYCEGGPTTTQKLAWHEPPSPFSRAYEEHLLKALIHSTVQDVSQKEGVGYEAVMGVVDRRVSAKVDWTRFSRLGILGIDELASSLLQDGQMKRIELEGQGIVLARVQGQYYAIGGNCTHYGGPLDEGVLKGHTVMCPWHHACFDIRSGLRLEPPALNDIPHYPVKIDSGEVVVSLKQDNETEPQGKEDRADKRTFVIVGGGSAGNAAAEELRRQGFKGKIVILSAVPDLPVDRPNLSKDYLAGKADPSWIPLRGDKGWYKARDIDLKLDHKVTKIDPKAHTVTPEKGDAVQYDKLLLATGGIPRQLGNTPGTDLKGVYLLRELEDADAIIKAADKGKRAVVIGASFIGMEAAASLAGGRGVTVTVVGPEQVPFAPVFGEKIGAMVRKEHEDNGIKFYLEHQVKQLTGKNGHVNAVELTDGTTLEADFVLIGIGVRPSTDYLQGSGLSLDDKDKSVKVSAQLQTSDPDIYAAGDIARYADGSERGKRIEHWRVAEQQGMVAARNMLGKAEAVTGHVPFFWTNQWSLTLNYVGNATSWDQIVYRGDPASKQFIAFFVQGTKLLAAVTCGADKEADAIEFILRDQRPLTPDQMRDDSFDLVAYSRT